MHQHFERTRGFTLVELITVIVILGILAAVAMPKFINVSNNARVAAVNALAAVVRAAAFQWHGICQLNRQECDAANIYPHTMTAQGLTVQFSNDFPEAGDNINSMQIDILINYSGFTATLPDQYNTRFTLDGAPDPANCFVNYAQAQLPGTSPVISEITSGC